MTSHETMSYSTKRVDVKHDPVRFYLIFIRVRQVVSWTKVWPVLFCYHLFWCAHQKPVYIHVLTWQYHTILSDAIWFISAFAFHSENPPCGRTRQNNNNNNNNNNRKINIQCSCMYIQPLYFQPLSSIRVTVSYVGTCDL